MDERIHRAMLEQLDANGHLPCIRAHAIAQALELPPLTVGLAATQADIRISRCLLGLFGYGPKKEGKHKIVQPMEQVPEPLAVQLRAKANDRGITCAAIWEIADDMDYKRLEVSSAVEALGLKISHCQLGCFPRPWEG